MSDHAVRVVEVTEKLPHPNADSLEIIPIGGWQVVARIGDYAIGDKAVYVEPDYVVPVDREEFSFLKKGERTKHRLKAIKLRKELSFGLLVPLPDDVASSNVGDCVMEALGIERYEPKIHAAGMGRQVTHEVPPPNLFSPKFDVESLRNHMTKLIEGEIVYATEKVHGCSAKYVWHDGVMHMASRNRWLDIENGDNVWSKAYAATPGIEQWCKSNPGVVLHGEVYGAVQSLRYGIDDGSVSFVAFAARNHDGEYLSHATLISLCSTHGVPTVPVVYHGPYSADVLKLAEQDSELSSTPQMMEGLVLVPEIPRHVRGMGNVMLKHISNRYWIGNH